DLAQHPALLVLDRLRARNAARSEVLHQTQEKGQVAFRDALFVERENESPGAGVHQEIRILDALRDAFVGEELADIVTREKAGEALRRHVGVDRHPALLRRLVLPQRAGQRKEHSLLGRSYSLKFDRETLRERTQDLLD